MHGDFSLNPLEHQTNVVRVLAQQGRVSLDSDLNAAQDVLIRYLRALAVDLIGPHGGNGFKLDRLTGDADVIIGAGHYWVDGLLAANGDPPAPSVPGIPSPTSATTLPSVKHQPFLQWPATTPPNAPLFDATSPALFFLDVWERHVSSAEDDSFREVALGGPDTASRSMIVWQVRMLPLPKSNVTASTDALNKLHWYLYLRHFFATTALLRARTDKNQNSDPCALPPDSRFRGRENQLYRVEVHTGSPEPPVDFGAGSSGVPGTPGATPPLPQAGAPTFKWSRDNGSNVLRVRRVTGNVIAVDSLGYDDRTGVSVGDWVELVDDRSILINDVQPILQVRKVDRASLEVTLSEPPPRQQGTQQVLRRWHGKDKPITEGSGTTGWLHLEDGISVQFTHDLPAVGSHRYRTGDYWLIPARVATGDIIWPGGTNPAAVPPHGVRHHYAPLAVWTGATFVDARMIITLITHLAP